MPEVDVIIKDVLQHQYDPVKAHEYYVRNRELLGLKPGAAVDPKGRRAAASIPASNSTAKAKASKVVVKKPIKQVVVKKHATKSTAARITELKTRLDALRDVLAALVKQAKARSGIDPLTGKTKDSTGAKGTADRKLTPTQKKEAADRSRKSYEKNKKVAPSKEAADLTAKIEEVKGKIQQMRAELAKVQSATQKRKANSVGVGTNSNHK